MTRFEAWTFLLLQMLIGSGLDRVIACKENMYSGDSNNQTSPDIGWWNVIWMPNHQSYWSGFFESDVTGFCMQLGKIEDW